MNHRLIAGLLLLPALALASPENAPPAARYSDNQLRFPPGAPQLSYLTLEPAQAAPLPVIGPLYGRLAYNENRTARLLSPVSGRVLEIVGETGQRVTRGSPLLYVDAPDYVESLTALREAEADAHQSRRALDRARALYGAEIIARKDFELAQLEQERAEQVLRRAQGRFRNLNPGMDTHDERYALRAPIDGIITERQINPGSEIRPDRDTPLFVITDPARLWGLFELSEKDVALLAPGQRVLVSVDAYPDRVFEARIEHIADIVDPVTRRVMVRAEIDNPEQRLKAEMFAMMTPIAEGRLLARVPDTALVTEGVKSYLFVEREPGLIEKREVRVAYRGHGTSWIAEGLVPGERIATTGALLLMSELAGR
ncbi:MAG: efflux RND transporter periplasmic adaptor subunit [Halothiobacillaceae bacterium]|jgi:cobalt-zinc-cadmium efflux system membrane fusion protein|nr:efflux RND transporter periplasmic adaptor subunit [Halothiobacillaceae bacterium]MDY0049326.1 efflux RND transporter periplasmic adaptor subunit [Halothiobacillaceae bacterium]